MSRLLFIRPLTTAPYHPICNGLVERFNGTLKQMLRRMENIIDDILIYTNTWEEHLEDIREIF